MFLEGIFFKKEVILNESQGYLNYMDYCMFFDKFIFVFLISSLSASACLGGQ